MKKEDIEFMLERQRQQRVEVALKEEIKVLVQNKEKKGW